MINIGIIAGGRRIIAWKNFIARDGPCAKSLGKVMENREYLVLPGSWNAISYQSGNRYFCGPPRADKVPEDTLRGGRSLKRILPLERGRWHGSRLYSNAEEENILVKDNKTGDEWGGPEAERLVVKLGDNIDESMKAYESLLVYFYTLWCKHCKKLKPVYGAAAVKMKEENVSGHLAAIDLTKRMDIADKFNIVSVPIMFYFKKGKFMKVYDGKRTAEDIVSFMRSPPEKPSVQSKIDI